jgi:hypothetical protein
MANLKRGSAEGGVWLMEMESGQTVNHTFNNHSAENVPHLVRRSHSANDEIGGGNREKRPWT